MVVAPVGNATPSASYAIVREAMSPHATDRTGERPVLRGWALTDAAAMREALTDPEIYRWTPLPRTSSEEQARAWIAKRLVQSETTQHEHFAIDAGLANGLVGGVNVFFHDARRAEIGYFILPAWRGRGLARAAVRLASEWAHGAGVERLEALIDVDNLVSISAVEAVGFRREGLLRHFRLQREAPRDMYMYARLASDPF